MPNRYPGIELLEKVSTLGQFHFDVSPGDVVFIGSYVPQAVYDQVKSQSDKNPYYNIHSIDDGLFKKGLLDFQLEPAIDAYQPPLLRCEAYSEQQQSLTVAQTETQDTTNTAIGQAKNDLAEIRHIKQKLPDFADYFSTDPAAKDATETLLKHQENPAAFPGISRLGLDSVARTQLRAVLPPELKQTGLVEKEQETINKKLLGWVEWLQTNAGDLQNAHQSLEMAEQQCADFIDKQSEQLWQTLSIYLENQAGLKLFADWCQPRNNARKHQPKVHLYNLETFTPAKLQAILDDISGRLTRGIIIVPSVMDRNSFKVFENFLNDTSHSFYAVTDRFPKPALPNKDDAASWFEDVVDSPSLLDTDRSHARMATFFPPLLRDAGKYGKITISPAYAGGALIARTALGYNPAYHQAPLNIGVIDDIDGTIGQMPGGDLIFSVKMREALINKGINVISMDYSPEENRYYFVAEPGRTLSSDDQKQWIVGEMIRALLEDVVQRYIRRYIQGGMGADAIEKKLDAEIFGHLRRNQVVEQLNVQVDQQPNGTQIDVTFSIKDPVTKIQVSVEKQVMLDNGN